MENCTACPSEREILRGFALPDDQGKRVDLEDHRQRHNLVLVFVKELLPPGESLLKELAGATEAVAAEEAVVLAVLNGTREDAALLQKRFRLPFPVLADVEGQITKAFCAAEASIYITDRFREIFALRHGGNLLSRDEILEWLGHINRQCPE